MKIYAKYKIEGYPNYVWGSDNNIYRLPFNRGDRYYGLKLITQQPSGRIKVNIGNGQEWLSINKAKNLKSINTKQEVIKEYYKKDLNDFQTIKAMDKICKKKLNDNDFLKWESIKDIVKGKE